MSLHTFSDTTCGHDKSAPTAANSLPIMLLTDCNNTTFKKQKPYFYNVKTPFLHAKNHTFATQKGGFCFSIRNLRKREKAEKHKKTIAISCYMPT